MSEKPENPPAFPCDLPPAYYYQDGKPEKVYPLHSGKYQGMPLRDYFAAKAMASYVNPDFLMRATTDEHVDYLLSNCANFSYRMADAMLKARQS